MKTVKDELELLMFTVNKKAEYAFNRWHENKSDESYWRGQYAGLSEVYILLQGERNRQE